MLPAPAFTPRIPRPITDKRLAQARAAEELLEALLRDLYQDMRNGAPMRACNFALIERLRPPPAVVCIAGDGAKQALPRLARRRTRGPQPITDQRLEQAFAAECLRDAILEDLYQDVAAGVAVLARRCVLLWRRRPIRAIRLTLECTAG